MLKPTGTLFSLALGLLSILSAQDTAKPGKSVSSDGWSTKAFDVKYIDPERLRQIFSGRSFVMEADTDLKLLTAHGSPAFLKEVEDTVKRFDVPPPPPANIQITVYLLTVAAQAPSGRALPPELAAIGKELAPAGSPALRLADSQTIRVREGQPGEAAALVDTPDDSKLSRIRIQSASIIPSAKVGAVSLNGLSVWLDILPATPETTRSAVKTNADISANIDVEQNQSVIVSRAGVDKPVVVIARAAAVH